MIDVDALGMEVDAAMDRLGHPMMDCLWVDCEPGGAREAMGQVVGLVRALGLDPVYQMQVRPCTPPAPHGGVDAVNHASNAVLSMRAPHTNPVGCNGCVQPVADPCPSGTLVFLTPVVGTRSCRPCTVVRWVLRL
jgi:hypothetical protein